MSKTSIYVCVITRKCPQVDPYYTVCEAAYNDPDTFGKVNLSRNGFNVAANRNNAIKTFLQTDCTHLFMVDDDVFLQKDAITLLKSVNADLVTGCCPYMHRDRPMLSILLDDKGWAVRWFDGIREIDACGGACLLISRKVCEGMKPPWFVWPDYHDEEHPFLGEDLYFSRRVKDAGFSLKAHGNVRCGHSKTIDLGMMIAQEGAPLFFSRWPGVETLEEQSGVPMWGSHMPVLKAIPKAFDIETVCEFGAGSYSTPLFVKDDNYPALKRLLSIETDMGWIDYVRHITRDGRILYAFCPIDKLIERSTQIGEYDLILVDPAEPQDPTNLVTGMNAEYNIRRGVFSTFDNKECKSIVVLHDTNEGPLMKAAEGASFKYSWTYKPQHNRPWTTVFSNVHDVTILEDYVDVRTASPGRAEPAPVT